MSKLRNAVASETDAIIGLLLQHGPSQWNHLPESEARAYASGIAQQKVFAAVAVDGNNAIIGVVLYEIGQFYPTYQPPESVHLDHGYIAELVVSKSYVGKGIGTRLLGYAIAELQKMGVREVYAMRHADNVPSGRAMQKCGMTIINEFDDPQIRTSGSRRTVITRISLPTSI